MTRSHRKWLFLSATLLAAGLLLFRHPLHLDFDWRTVRRQLAAVYLRPLLLATAVIYICYWLRGLRWAILIRPLRRASPNALFPSQAIGFTAVALIGRVADFARPYLVARRLDLPVLSQLAVYSVERAFDLAAAAAVFSVTLLFAPATLPHHAVYVRAGVLSFAATLLLAGLGTALRLAGSRVAALLRRLFKPVSTAFAEQLSERVLAFSEGFRTLASGRQFFLAAVTSLLMWFGIASCYLLCARAFTAEPTLAHMSFTAIMLVFASSLGGSLLQLPVLGWFTQIAVNATALHTLLGVPLEPATACSTVMLFVLNLAILPVGLVAARMQGTSLRAASRSSEAAVTQSLQ